MRRTSLRRRSSKRQKYYDEVRIPLVKKILSERPYCEAGAFIKDPRHRCQLDSMDVHERKPRSLGGSMEDPDNLMSICRLCHGWVGDNVAAAHDLGLSIHSWDEITPLFLPPDSNCDI